MNVLLYLRLQHMLLIERICNRRFHVVVLSCRVLGIYLFFAHTMLLIYHRIYTARLLIKFF